MSTMRRYCAIDEPGPARMRAALACASELSQFEDVPYELEQA